MKKKLTPKQAKRYSEIIRQLCVMSRNGWRDALPSDYLPLEAELRQLLDIKYAKTANE